MAAIANGTSTPPTGDSPPNITPADHTTPALKRKREDDVQTTGERQRNASPQRRQIQQDILDLLQQRDTAPSFLKHDFDDAPAPREPPQKKSRSTTTTTKTTIRDKLAGGAYPSLGSLTEDAARVSKDIESALRTKTRDGETKDGGRLSVEELKQIQCVKAFEDLARAVVDKERQRYGTQSKGGVKEEASRMGNGSGPASTGDAERRAGTVLTLFGNAPTPKQLFSSMQHAPGMQSDLMTKSELPVEEMSLPNGLTATHIMPAPLGENKKGPTFEEAFPPPYSLPALPPPKTHKRSSTRDTKLTWEFRDPITRGSKKGGYTVQSLATGEWLGYGGVDAATASASARERRRQRDRALSSGAEAAVEPLSEDALAEQQAREEEAMFRRAYSSFAPSHDDAKAIIPAETKNMLWWDKVGEQRFLETFAIDPALVGEQTVPAIDPASAVETVSDDFEQVMDTLESLDVDVADIERVTTKTEVEQVLLEASQLLETLASHQRIRSATLPTSTAATRTPISPAPILATKAGKPDEPADDEVSTYHAARRELAYLVLKLPPYAVAKLDGDQLNGLGVSKLITVHSKDVKGIMEEDQVARLAKHNAMATAAGIATLTRSSSSASGQHYSTTSQRTPAIGQAANTRYGVSSQYASSRTPAPAPQYQRSVSNQSNYGTPSTTAPRPSYGTQSAQYSRPAAPQQNSYTQPNGQQYYQQRTAQAPGYYSTGNTHNYTPTSTQQQSQRPTYAPTPSAPLQQFQQRSHAAAANAVAYQTNNSTGGGGGGGQGPQRTASPANVQPRAVYPATGAQQFHQHGQPMSGRGTPTAYAGGASQPQTPVGGAGHARPLGGGV
ncbi:hypothetical protein LTR53_011964 [Teratosphaeriaceae sp. CCFEE 6253]|nr:hypothetical protein LTR53_011964 [Teratosphaeriaceae sp. CCFEE 6253]